MDIGPATRIGDLLSDYPYIEDFLVTYHAAFTRLTNPLLKHTIDRNATLDDAAAMAGVSVSRLVEDVRSEVEAHPSAQETTGGS